jgi:transcriptional regulator with XRE-family HTH domain
MPHIMRPSPQRHTLAILRVLIGFTQKEMAQILECSVPTIQAVELGKLKLSPKLAQRVHFQTGVSIEWLLDGDVSKPPVTEEGMAYTKALFEGRQASLLAPKETSHEALFDLWTSWMMFIKHVKVLAILYTEAYKRRKVPLIFYKSLMSAKDLFEKTIGPDKRIEKQLEELKYRNLLVPVSLFELCDTLESFEADTYEELKRIVKRQKQPISAFVRDHFREYGKRSRRARKKK